MEENKIIEQDPSAVEDKSSFDVQDMYRALILNWHWFIISLIVCLGSAYLYLRYTQPIYQSYAKMLIKDDDGNRSRGIQNMSNLGIVTNSAGIDNEMEILKSHTLAKQVVKDLKLYTSYKMKGRMRDHLYYKDQPITVDMDAAGLDKLNAPVSMTITRDGDKYVIKGTYFVPTGDESYEGPYEINKTVATLPATVNTRAGNIILSANPISMLNNGETLNVTLQSPQKAAFGFMGALGVQQFNKTTTIALLTMVDAIPQRSIDYLKQLSVVYNRQANEDKNEISRRTEQFINTRLEKISNELGKTESELQDFKQNNDMVELKMNASAAFGNQNSYEQKLSEMDTQIALLNSITDFMAESSRSYQVLPSNVGLTDGSSTQLINKYNELVLERNRLLRTASENSPVVEPITDQIRELNTNIRRALTQARRSLEIQRSGIQDQYNKYNSAVAKTPLQERQLTQIGRQQEVKSGLYLMLLQKREENSISLAATADKGKLLDDPQFAGKVAPKSSMIMLIGLILGITIPALIIIAMRFFRYKIEGHDDVVKLTRLPILSDVPIASEQAKGKAGIVVKENENNQMEEIFRSLRTNLQFMMKQNDKVIMFTSSTSGEGKTFNCANLSVSFALLGKKVILVGLDIRRPRLAELFEIKDHHHGISSLLTKDAPTWEEIGSQIIASGINKNLDLLMAGPIPPNPTELIARQSLETIFNELRAHYDIIVVDTAPVGLVTDTLQIGRVADVTAYICRADYTPKASFDMINSLAVEKKLPNMAVVINGIDMSKRKYGYAYGYGRYGKYGRYGQYKKGKYSSYGQYGNYGSYGNYNNSHYGNPNDKSVKR